VTPLHLSTLHAVARGGIWAGCAWGGLPELAAAGLIATQYEAGGLSWVLTDAGRAVVAEDVRRRWELVTQVAGIVNHAMPQLHAYQTLSPERYAHRALQVDLCMEINARPCAGGECDEGDPCPRHARTTAVVDRYLRLRARRPR
jgi:hypothetical protein